MVALIGSRRSCSVTVAARILCLVALVGGGMRDAVSQTAEMQELEQRRTEGIQAYGKGDYAAAEKSFRAGLEKAQQLNDKRWAGRFLVNLGYVADTLAQFDKAGAAYAQAITLFEEINDKSLQVTALNNLVSVYNNLGQYDKSQNAAARALALSEELNDKSGIAKSLGNLGTIHSNRGQYDKALDYYTRALALFQALNDAPNIALVLNNVGSVYNELGRFHDALNYFQQALTRHEQSGDKWNTANVLNNIGNVYKQLGHANLAKEFYTRALTLCEAQRFQQLTPLVLSNLAGIYHQQGQLRAAQDFYARALQLNTAMGSVHNIADNLHNLGAVCIGLQEYDKATEYLTRALTEYAKIGHALSTAYTFANLADGYALRGELDKAEDAFKQALARFEAVSEQVGDASQMGVFQESLMGNVYARYAALLLRRERPMEALAMVERGRGRGLARQMAQSRVDLTPLLAPEDAAQWQARLAELAAASQHRRAARDRLADAAPETQTALAQQRDAAEKRFEEAQRQFTLLRDGLFAKYPAYSRLQGAQPPTAEDLASLARRQPDTLFLEWAVVDDGTTLLFALSHKDGLKTFKLSAGRTALADAIRKWRAVLLARREVEPQQARALYTALLQPLEPAGLLAPQRYARLALVADALLLDVPFAALLDANGKRLVERYPLSVSVSLGALTWQTPSLPSSAPLLCLADPTGGQNAAPRRATRGEFAALQHARVEVSRVASLFPRSVALVGAQAREAWVKREMGKYALLHFATHGVLDESNGLYSGLLLAPETKGNKEDGVLEGWEIVGLKLSARCAVLSACETARGQAGGGEGLLGLAWAFRAAGCPSVVASQWKVDDAATERLMVEFYKGLKAGRRKDDALRAAMLTVRTLSPPPFFWAGFQVIGDAAPLPALK